MLLKSDVNPNLLSVCVEVYKRLEDRNSRKDCVKEILELKFDGKLSDQDYVYYQFLKVLNEMYKEGFNAGKKLNEVTRQAEDGDVNMRGYLVRKISSRKKVSDSFAMQLAPIIQEIRDKGATTLQEIGDQLTALGIKTVSGYDQWHPATVRHIEEKIAKGLLS